MAAIQQRGLGATVRLAVNAAAICVQRKQASASIASMMSEVHPRVVAALNTQLSRWRAALGRGERRIGWKIGPNFPEVEEVIGGDPIIGHLCSATLLATGDTYTAHDSPNLRGETELPC